MTEDHPNRPDVDRASPVPNADPTGSGSAVVGSQTFGSDSAEDFAGSTTWMFTMAILAGLLLIGFFTGFVTRGAATAAVPATPIQDYVIASATLAARAEETGTSRYLKIASNTGDQLLNMRQGSNDEWSAVIKLHASSADQPDELSIVKILPDGQIQETLRRPGTREKDTIALAAANGGAYFGYSTANGVAVQKISSGGDDIWSRTFPALVDQNSKLQIEEVSGNLVLFAMGEEVGQRRVAVIGDEGNLSWERIFEVHAGSQFSIGGNGEMFLLAAADSKTELQLVALTPAGATAWESAITLSAEEEVLGMAVTDNGGVVVATLASGVVTLIEFDVTGEQASSVELTNLLGDVEPVYLSATDAGNFLVYGFSQIDPVSRKIYVKQLSADGSIIGSADTILRNEATLEFIQMQHTGHVVLAGTDRPDRYSATDVFVTTLALEFDSRSMPSNEIRPDLIAELPQDFAVESEIQQVAFRQPDESPDAARVVAVAEDPQIDAATPEAAVLNAKRQATLPEATLTRFMTSRTSSQRASLETPAMQCRFTCMEPENGAAAFPIWRPIEFGGDASKRAVQELHSAVCEAAGGLPMHGMQPDCTG